MEGRKVAFDGKLSPTRALLGEQRGRIALALNSRLVEASCDGALSLSPAPALEGKEPCRRPCGALDPMARPASLPGDSGAVDVTATLGLELGGAWPSRTSTGRFSGGTLSGTLALETDRVRPYLEQHAAPATSTSAVPCCDPTPPALHRQRRQAGPMGWSGRAPPRRSRRRPGRPRRSPGASGARPPAAGARRRSICRCCDSPMPTSRWWSTVFSTASLTTGQSQLRAALKDNVAKLTLAGRRCSTADEGAGS